VHALICVDGTLRAGSMSTVRRSMGVGLPEIPDTHPKFAKHG